MRLNLTSLLALLALASTASAAGCDCFDYTAADAGDKCDGGYNSNKADIDAHCKDSGIKTAAVCCGSCSDFGC